VLDIEIITDFGLLFFFPQKNNTALFKYKEDYLEGTCFDGKGAMYDRLLGSAIDAMDKKRVFFHEN
jgi:hypothetical protein